jgi:hypothetical protein
MTTPLIPQCQDAKGAVRRCKGCPHLGRSRWNGRVCDAVARAAVSPALAAFEKAIKEAP